MMEDPTGCSILSGPFHLSTRQSWCRHASKSFIFFLKERQPYYNGDLSNLDYSEGGAVAN